LQVDEAVLMHEAEQVDERLLLLVPERDLACVNVLQEKPEGHGTSSRDLDLLAVCLAHSAEKQCSIFERKLN
jgi:hypothetical protein